MQFARCLDLVSSSFLLRLPATLLLTAALFAKCERAAHASPLVDVYLEGTSGGRPTTASSTGRVLYAPLDLQGLAPIVGVGYDMQSFVRESTKMERTRSHGYVSVGAAYFAPQWRLVLEHRWREYLDRVDATLRPEQREWRATFAIGTVYYQSSSYAAAGQWLAEPYGELVIKREGDVDDALASGYVRAGRRLQVFADGKLALDALVEPFVSRSQELYAGDNRAELRAGARVSAVGGGWGGSFTAGAVRGCFLDEGRAREAGEAQCYSAPRQLFTLGRFL